MNLPQQDYKPRIFTWHIHGSYLYYLSKGDYIIYIPVTESKEEGYYGRGKTFPFGNNVIEVPADEVRSLSFDCILFQSNKNFLVDQYEILSDAQRTLPRIYLEHDPPWKHPTDARHVMTDAEVLLVHVTYFNKLMWMTDVPKVKVIEHGVEVPSVRYTGNKACGITVINHLHQRGRKLGADIYEDAKTHIPLELVGMGTAEYGGRGEVLHPELPSFISQYRFFFNPIRYTSLGLAVCEAMMMGMPVISLATTEYSSVLTDGVDGFIHTDVDYLKAKMELLLKDKSLAFTIGHKAKQTAERRFNIRRFTRDWKDTFLSVIDFNTTIYEKENSHYQ